jgi:hypothetical protein
MPMMSTALAVSIASIASAGIGAGVSIYEATRKPTILTPGPTSATTAAITGMQTEADKAAEALRARARQAGAAGRASTILTSPQGVLGSSVATVTPKTLLGQ